MKEVLRRSQGSLNKHTTLVHRCGVPCLEILAPRRQKEGDQEFGVSLDFIIAIG